MPYNKLLNKKQIEEIKNDMFHFLLEAVRLEVFKGDVVVDGVTHNWYVEQDRYSKRKYIRQLAYTHFLVNFVMTDEEITKRYSGKGK